jgi:hypothetical protein
MIPVFIFAIVMVLYLYILEKWVISDSNIFWFILWALATFSVFGSFMWWALS